MSLAGPTAPMLVTKEGDSAAPPPPRHGGSARAREDRRAGYLLITPTVVIVFTMVVLPIVWTISLGFQQVRLLNLRQAGFIGDYSLENFKNVLGSSGFVDALVTTLIYSVARHGVRDRARPVGRARPAQAVPRPRAGAGLHAGAVRRPGGRRDLRVDDDAQPAVRHRQLLRHHAARLGRADRLPQLRRSRSRSSASTPTSPPRSRA